MDPTPVDMMQAYQIPTGLMTIAPADTSSPPVQRYDLSAVNGCASLPPGDTAPVFVEDATFMAYDDPAYLCWFGQPFFPTNALATGPDVPHGVYTTLR